MLVVELVSATNVKIQTNRRCKSMLVHADKLKRCRGDKLTTWLSAVEGDVTDVKDVEEEEVVRQLSKEPGDELQLAEDVEHATMGEARGE